MRRHLLAVPLALALLAGGASIANACIPGYSWYQPCGIFGTKECVCDCYGTTGGEGIPVNCRELSPT